MIWMTQHYVIQLFVGELCTETRAYEKVKGVYKGKNRKAIAELTYAINILKINI